MTEYELPAGHDIDEHTVLHLHPAWLEGRAYRVPSPHHADTHHIGSLSQEGE